MAKATGIGGQIVDTVKTIVYALLSGEEQGLYGGRLLARHAVAQGWTVKAVINRAQDLDLTRDVTLDGRATLVLSYI